MPLFAFATTAVVRADDSSSSSNSGSSSSSGSDSTTSGSSSSSSGSDSSSSTSGSDSTTDTTDDTLKPDDTNLQTRLAERKSALQTKLTAAQEAKIKSKCRISQGAPVKVLELRIRGVEKSRKEVYTNLVNRLTKLDGQLKAKNLDTTEFDGELVTLKTKITTFESDLAKYKQALIDLKSVDCVSDPTGFQASLDSARTLRDQVSKDAADVKNYVNDTIKPTLKKIRDQLAEKEKQESSGGTQ